MYIFYLSLSFGSVRKLYPGLPTLKYMLQTHASFYKYSSHISINAGALAQILVLNTDMPVYS